MTRSNNNCRTAVVALTAGDSIREAHSYEYDNNGNIVYVNTSRVKPDMTAQPDTVQRSREERFRWDEENRLTALSQNGYVSNYWYDANGDRVIKEHGENMAVFVNSRQDGCVTQTGRYSVYPNPYYSYGDDGRYTKHIYIGSERVLSQVGGVYGEPRLLDVAGHDVRIKVDYPQIRASQDSVMEAAYSHFDLPYNGTDHDNFGRYKFDLPGYWNGSLQTPRDSEEDGDEGTPARAQELLYYYHTDHLGSSTLVTDGNGQLVQQIEYLPYGEVFLERQNGDYATPYKFNGKELDEETGLYYYGARYMNPRLSIWYGCDPLQEKNPGITTYSYCHGNPVNTIDPFGLDTIHMNLNAKIDYVNHEGNDINVVIFGKSERLSGIDISKSLYNRKVVTNIINYYASQLSLYGVKIGSEQGNGSVPAFHRDGVIYINQCSNGSISNILNNKYNLWNVLVHEGLHKLNGRESGYLGHAKIYLDMFAHDTFQKTTTEFKSSVIKSFVGLVLMAYHNGNQQQKNEAVWLISRFNAEKYGVSLSFDKTLKKITANGAVSFNRFIFNFTGDGYNINFRKSKTY